MSKVYDCFIFYNELDLLEIRLNELDNYVDKFILVESKKTFTGLDKELFFEKNKHLFEKFSHKITHIIVDDFNENMSAWDREIHQRNAIKRGLKEAVEDDIIIISDVDEIPNPKAIMSCKDKEGIKVLEQNLYFYYLNCINKKSPYWHRGPRVLFYKDYTQSADEIRNTYGDIIKNGGWHFTYLGGTQSIINKLKSFSHQEYNTPYYTEEERIEKAIKQGKDIFDRDYDYEITPVDDTYPGYILKNIDKYKDFIMKKETCIEKLISKFQDYKNRKIQPYERNQPLIDFISSSFDNIIVLSENKDIDTIKQIKQDYKIKKYDKDFINSINDNSLECLVIANLDEIKDIERLLQEIKPKMTKNGYILGLSNNKDYIGNTGEYNRKSVEILFRKNNYYFATFKGVKPNRNFLFNLFDILSAYSLYNSKFKQYIFVAKH